MILTCGDWFFNKMEKRTMQADQFDVADLLQNCGEPTPLLVSDLEKNGFVLNNAWWTTPFFEKKIGVPGRDNKWIDVASIEVSKDLTFVSVKLLLREGEYHGIGSFSNLKGLQVHELQQFLRLCGYEDIADNFVL